jgi:hypothetical protein
MMLGDYHVLMNIWPVLIRRQQLMTEVNKTVYSFNGFSFDSEENITSTPWWLISGTLLIDLRSSLAHIRVMVSIQKLDTGGVCMCVYMLLLLTATGLADHAYTSILSMVRSIL